MGIGVSVASVALGACLIEKHFTLARADGGVDSSFSLEPNELQNLVAETERAWLAIGRVRYGPTEAEKKSLVFRRSIYVAKNIAKGEVFSTDNLRVVRPGDGLPPKFLKFVVGTKASVALRAGTPLGFEYSK